MSESDRQSVPAPSVQVGSVATALPATFVPTPLGRALSPSTVLALQRTHPADQDAGDHGDLQADAYGVTDGFDDMRNRGEGAGCYAGVDDGYTLEDVEGDEFSDDDSDGSSDMDMESQP